MKEYWFSTKGIHPDNLELIVSKLEAEGEIIGHTTRTRLSTVNYLVRREGAASGIRVWVGSGADCPKEADHVKLVEIKLEGV